MKRILAIESSCDDTSASVIENGAIKSNIISNQDVHKLYGGVIPELASRKHHENIVPTIHQALKQAGLKSKDLDAIAVTQGPGLLGSLLVGCSFAKSYAYTLGVPLIAINHMEAHVMAHFIESPAPVFPFLCLTVSGGHTQILKVTGPNQMKVIGSTIDDASGEAFDKIGKYLSLEYPAGPIIDKLAMIGEPTYSFTKPKVDGLNFSFSGLKTAVLYFLKKEVKNDPDFIVNNLNNICASVQNTIIQILLDKIQIATEQEDINQIAIAGGVSSNSGLRAELLNLAKSKGWTTFFLELQYCTDNAAMIAMSAHYKYLDQDFVDIDITPLPRLSIS